MDLDIYLKEFMQVDLAKMDEIKRHRDKVINLDTDESEQDQDSEEEDSPNMDEEGTMTDVLLE